MSSFGNLYLVIYYDGALGDSDRIVYHSSSLKALFDEIVDLLGDDATVYHIERMSVTDLDIKEIDKNEL